MKIFASNGVRRANVELKHARNRQHGRVPGGVGSPPRIGDEPPTGGPSESSGALFMEFGAGIVEIAATLTPPKDDGAIRRGMESMAG